MIHPSAVTTNPLVRMLISVLPARMKRVVFLASLTAIAKESKVPEESLIRKLNLALNLSTTGDAALKLPIHVSSLIWADKQVFRADIQQLIGLGCESVTARQSCADRIVGYTPSWLKYGSPANIAKDIQSLFSNDSCIFQPQAAGA